MVPFVRLCLELEPTDIPGAEYCKGALLTLRPHRMTDHKPNGSIVPAEPMALPWWALPNVSIKSLSIKGTQETL